MPRRSNLRKPPLPQLWVALTKVLTKGLKLTRVSPIGPAVAMRDAAAIPVEILGQRPPPVARMRAAQPKIPVLATDPNRFVVPAHGGMHGRANGTGCIHEIIFEKRAAVMKPLFPQIFEGSKPNRITSDKSEFRIRFEIPYPFFDCGRLQKVVTVDLHDIAGPRGTKSRVPRRT